MWRSTSVRQDRLRGGPALAEPLFMRHVDTSSVRSWTPDVLQVVLAASTSWRTGALLNHAGPQQDPPPVRLRALTCLP